MAGELKIRAGTKLRMALDVPIGEQPKFNLICTFVKSLDVASFLISIPMVDGKPKVIAKKRAEKRQNLYQAQDEVDDKKEELLTKVEKMLEQKIEMTELFTIRWRVI